MGDAPQDERKECQRAVARCPRVCRACAASSAAELNAADVVGRTSIIVHTRRIVARVRILAEGIDGPCVSASVACNAGFKMHNTCVIGPAHLVIALIDQSAVAILCRDVRVVVTG